MKSVFGAGMHLALVDSDGHSARLLMKTFSELGASSVRWLGDSPEALDRLAAAWTDKTGPSLLVVDLKHGAATRDFLLEISDRARRAGTIVVAFAASLDRTSRAGLIEAGAWAVFARQGDVVAYRREAAAILDFWSRNESALAVGS